MSQLIERWTRKSNQRFKNWLGKSFNSAVNKAGGVYKTAILDPQKEMNLELAQYQFDKNKEMWDLQNQYNSPSAQRQRMEEAGFNPNYMAGGGASSTGNATGSLPQYNVQAPTVDPMSFYSKIIGAAQGLMSLRAGMANIAKIKSQTGKLGLESDYLGGTMHDRKTRAYWMSQHAANQSGLAEQLYQHRGGWNAGIMNSEGVLRQHINPNRRGMLDTQKTALDAQIDNKRAQTIFQNHRNELMRKYGITTSDNFLFRMGIKALDTIGIDPTNWLRSGSEGLSNYMRSK